MFDKSKVFLSLPMLLWRSISFLSRFYALGCMEKLGLCTEGDSKGPLSSVFIAEGMKVGAGFCM